MTTKKKSRKKSSLALKIVLSIGTICAIVFLYFGYVFFGPTISPKSDDNKFIYITDSTNYNGVIAQLENNTKIFNVSAFKLASKLLHYGEKIHSGRYEIHTGMSNFKLIRKLRNGRQTPLKLTFNNIRTKEQLAGRLGKQLMADSTEIINLLNDSAFLKKYDLNPNTSISLFIPNTYEVFWNLRAEQLFERMDKEYTKFWNVERKEKAAAIPLSKAEVSTLASIVEEETNNKKDKPMVAGLYINRLRTRMPLQADPTVKYAVGDFSLKRILLGHLKTVSPYNTYKNIGLPPGPIRVATPEGIDAVLNYAHHNYIFMCASETLNGEHKFSVSWEEHKINARNYQRELNKRAIYK